MLLKPSQFNTYTRIHFSDDVLDEWYKSITNDLIGDVEEEAQSIHLLIQGLIYVCIYKRYGYISFYSH